MTAEIAYRYMPDLPMWLHWGIYVATAIVAIVGVVLADHKLRRAHVTWREWYVGMTRVLWRRRGAVASVWAHDVIGQRRTRRNRAGAVLHSLIFYSFLILLGGTTLIGIQHDVTLRLFGMRYLVGGFYVAEKFVLDTAALGLIAGVLLAMRRRYLTRPSHLGPRASIPAVYAGLLFVALSGLVLEATRELALPAHWYAWSYAGHVVAVVIGPLATAHRIGLYQAAWAVHVASAFALLGAAGATTLDHVLLVTSNLTLSTDRGAGLVTKPFDLPALLEAEADLEGLSAGIAFTSQLSWDRRLMVDACLNCGRCEAVCPATAAGRPLSPRRLVQALRDDLHEGSGVDVFTGGRIDEDTVWSCLTCSACRVECPVGIDQPGLILGLRRHLAEEGRLDEPKSLVLSGLERNQNPLGLPSYQRQQWLRDLGVPTIEEKPDAEFLYWIGCMASYDDRAKSIVRSMLAIMDRAGVTYALLSSEQCHGESQRRLGDEAGFQMRTMEIAENLRAAGDATILTHCPHCVNTFVNDYREFGIELKVLHHSQLVATLMAQGRLNVTANENETVAYHDPCNLGRVLGEYAAPRAVVRATSSRVVEFERSGDRSFCCGAGGANYFYKAPARQSVSGMRLDQAREVGASTVATACPFCMGMLEDAARTSESEGVVQIRDVAELVAERLAPI